MLSIDKLKQIAPYSIPTIPLKSIWVDYICFHSTTFDVHHYQTIGNCI
jgi:hypothetical protein